MLLNIIYFIAKKAWFRHILLVRFPCATAGFDVVRQTGCVDETVVAIDINSECITTYQGNVIGQTGMRDGVILC